MANEKKTNSASLESRRVVHEGRVFSVEVDRVRMPNGRTVSMDVVRHPGSAVIIAMPSPEEVILIRQYRYTIDRWIWELPAGSLERGEDPAKGAARECEEELGLVPGSVRRMRAFFPTPGFCDEEMIFFRCTDLQPPSAGSSAHQDEDEDLEPQTFSIEDARRMAREGEIVDLKTAIGLTLI